MYKNNTPSKWYHMGLRTLKWGFNGLRPPSDCQIILLQISIALYQTRRIGVIGEEQYQINNLTKPYIIPLQVLNSSQQWNIYYRSSYQNNI